MPITLVHGLADHQSSLIDMFDIVWAHFFSSVFRTVSITTRYSAVFLNGEFMGEPNSGNPGESKIRYFVLRTVVEINCTYYSG